MGVGGVRHVGCSRVALVAVSVAQRLRAELIPKLTMTRLDCVSSGLSHTEPPCHLPLLPLLGAWLDADLRRQGRGPHRCGATLTSSCLLLMIKRELNRRLIYECRCDERLKDKAEESTRLAYTGLRGGLEHLIVTRSIDERLRDGKKKTAVRAVEPVEPSLWLRRRLMYLSV